MLECHLILTFLHTKPSANKIKSKFSASSPYTLKADCFYMYKIFEININICINTFLHSVSNLFVHFSELTYSLTQILCVIHINSGASYIFCATVCKTVRPMLSDHCPVLSVCNIGVLWPNGWTDQDETWHAGRPGPRPHCVRWGPSAPQRGTAPNFRPMSVVAKRLDGSRCHLVWR